MRRVRRLSVLLVVVLLLGIGAAPAFGIEAVRGAAAAKAAQANAEEEQGKAVQAELFAQTQQKAAERAQQSEMTQRERAEKEHDRAERLVYARELESAQREWEANNVVAAWQHLEATRPDLPRLGIPLPGHAPQ